MPPDVVIHPFGEVDVELIEAVTTAVEQNFGVKVTVGGKQSIPADSYTPSRGQYRSTSFLDTLAALDRGDRQVRLGIATVDLFAPDLNFVFGEASSAQRVAVFSTARLAEGDDESMLVRRAVIEAVHELGHVWGLGHCNRRDCVMWFSNTLAETDRKGSKFCRRCARQLLTES